MRDMCIGRIGIHFFFENDHQVVLSHEQIDLLRLLLSRNNSEMTRYELCEQLYGERNKRESISDAKRAALSRSLRRLADMQYIERTPSNVKLTDRGVALINWLINDWDYDKHYQNGVKWGILPQKKTLTDSPKSPIG